MQKKSILLISLTLIVTSVLPIYSETKQKEFFFHDGVKCVDSGTNRNFPKCEALDPFSIYRITPRQVELYRRSVALGCFANPIPKDNDVACDVIEHIGASFYVTYHIPGQPSYDYLESGVEHLETGKRIKNTETDQAKMWYTIKIMGMSELCLILSKRELVDESDCLSVVLQERTRLLPED